MRRITLWVVSTLAAVILLFSYRTSLGAAGQIPTSEAAAGTPTTDNPPLLPDPSPSATHRHHRGSSAPPTSQQPQPQTQPRTITGPVVATGWGPVQVQVVVAQGQLIDVRALRHPTGNSHSDQINAYALPRLRAAALQAQSAHFDTVSGATVTSGGYLTSLQAALDAAHL